MPDVPTIKPEQFCQGATLLLVPDVRATADCVGAGLRACS
jgi:hypothetical protein